MGCHGDRVVKIGVSPFCVDGGMVIDPGLKMADLIFTAPGTIDVSQVNPDGLDGIRESVFYVFKTSRDVAC